MRIAELLQSLHENARIAAAEDGHLSIGAFPAAFFDELTDAETCLTLGASTYRLVRKRNIWDNETTYTLKLSDDVEISGANTKRIGQTLTIALRQVIGASSEAGLLGRSADCLFGTHPLLKRALQGYKIQHVITDKYAGTMIKIQ